MNKTQKQNSVWSMIPLCLKKEKMSDSRLHMNKLSLEGHTRSYQQLSLAK